jgi:putative transcriptional regulator
VDNKLFKELTESIKEGGAILRGKKAPSRKFDFGPRVKNLREKLGQSQSEFAGLLHVPLSTLQNWEQGRRKPQGPAQALLLMVEKMPREAIQILRRMAA